MKFGSLFSGIGGFDLGFERAGMECAWQCEIDRAARSVLRKQFPHAELHTDVAKLSRPTPVDVLCGGFPCQDLSVAGRRAGLAGARSGLWHEFRRIAGEIEPSVIVIENVPGLLSSNDGRDFGVLLSGLEQLGYRWAYRILDSQFDGVAQRRRRVFVVGSLGNGCCAEILFESESLRWDFAPCRQAGEKPAPTLGAGPVSGGRKYGTDADSCESLVPVWPAEVASTLNAHYGDKWGLEDQHALNGAALFVPASTGTMRSNGDAHSGFAHGDGLIPFDTTQITSRENRSNPQPGDPCHPLTAGGHVPAIAHTLRGEGYDASPRDDGDSTLITAYRTSPNCGAWETGQRTDALMTGTDPSATVVVSTLRSNHRSNSNPQTEAAMHVQTRQGVRRLTPRECERLQGFPDDWTRWTDTGKEQADGPRYKQLGNAVTVTVAQWLGGRINR